MLPYLILIPLFPLLGFLVVGVLGQMGLLDDRWAHRIAVGASALACVVAIFVAVDFAGGVEKYAALAESDPAGYEVVVGDDEQASRFEVTYWEWLPFGDVQLRGWDAKESKLSSISVGWTFAVDALTLTMLLVVTFVGTLIHVYAIGYMAGDPGYKRFFCYLNLFMTMMLTLVLGGNLLVMFIGWEGVGLCSYLLIGFFYDQIFDKESGLTCADAGRKAFITNRLGDFGFLLGALLLVITFGTLDFSQISDAINGSSAFWYGSALLTGVGLLLFVGATGKSAQIPLYVWLPDAMAGPTPVSALIHAATMVTAGVYMLARMASLFWHAPGAMFVVAVVGCMTAVFAATMGMAQYDIKKVLAYSTVSQLGFMFLGVGVGAFVPAVFHLVTHAFFKACLFLGSGSVIARAGHCNDMRLYGGLRRFMPVTFATYLVATLAITGMPFLSGFMSKDEILAKSLFSNHGHWLLWVCGSLAAVMTSFYMFRSVYMTFYGENRSPEHVRAHLKESPRVMTGVLVTLAVGAVFIGFIGIPSAVTGLWGGGSLNWFESQLHPVVAARGVVAGELGHGHGHGHGEDAHGAADAEHAAEPAGEHAEGEPTEVAHAAAEAAEHAEPAHGAIKREGAAHPGIATEWGLFGLATAIFLGGFLIARWAFTGDRAEALGQRLGFVRRLLYRKWFVDETYDRLFLRPFWALSRFFDGLDRRVVDGSVNFVAASADLSGQVIKLFHTGVVRHYALWLLGGAVLVLWIMTR